MLQGVKAIQLLLAMVFECGCAVIAADAMGTVRKATEDEYKVESATCRIFLDG
jgi:hypothetical protein